LPTTAVDILIAPLLLRCPEGDMLLFHRPVCLFIA
jgi:hypothetical protein